MEQMSFDDLKLTDTDLARLHNEYIPTRAEINLCKKNMQNGKCDNNECELRPKCINCYGPAFCEWNGKAADE